MSKETGPAKNFLSERQTALVDEFTRLSSWEDRYKKIIAMGKSLPDLPAEKKTAEALIKGCQSQVWLHAKAQAGDKPGSYQVILEGDSDALIVKGLVAVLIHLYNGSSPQEILLTPPDFIRKIGFDAHLSPSRSNGFFNMLKQIRNFALAMSTLN